MKPTYHLRNCIILFTLICGIIILFFSSCKKQTGEDEVCPGCGSLTPDEIRVTEIVNYLNNNEIRRFVFVYNDDQLIRIEGFRPSRENENEWIHDYNLEISYDDASIEMISSDLIDGMWEPDGKAKICFNGELPAEKVVLKYAANDWVNDVKINFSWDGNLAVELLYFEWIDDTWNRVYKNVYEYNTEGRLTGGSGYNYVASTWEETIHYEFTYLDDHLCEVLESSVFSQIEHKYTFRFSGIKLTEMIKYKKENGNWNLLETMKYTYNNIGLINRYTQQVGGDIYATSYKYEKGCHNLKKIVSTDYFVEKQYHLPVQVLFNNGYNP